MAIVFCNSHTSARTRKASRFPAVLDKAGFNCGHHHGLIALKRLIEIIITSERASILNAVGVAARLAGNFSRWS